MRVGILGYGRLGKALARRAADAAGGHEVIVLFDDGASTEARRAAAEAGLRSRSLEDPKAEIDILFVALNRARLRGELMTALSFATGWLRPDAIVATATRLGEDAGRLAPTSVLRISCSPAIATFPDECKCFVAAEAPHGAMSRLEMALAPASWIAVPEPEFDARERCFAMAGVICALIARFDFEAEHAHQHWLADSVAEARLLLAATRYDAMRAHDITATPGGVVQSLSRQLLSGVAAR